MKISFDPPSIEKKYDDPKWLTKHYGKEICLSFQKFVNFVECADNAYDLKAARQYFMEHTKQNMSSYYSITLDKKRSKWRLIIQMIDENGDPKKPGDNEPEFLKSIKEIRIGSMSEHYGEY